MNALDCSELHFLLDRDNAFIAFQEKDNSWAGALAFSSEERARQLVALSHLDVAEIAAIATDDHESVAALVSAMKRRLIRYVLLDLDYHTGVCRQVEFEADGFGAVTERRFTAGHRHS
ncbi:MAG: hypothetical protein ACREQN_14440 [Candidatus Binataceae bacterium]